MRIRILLSLALLTALVFPSAAFAVCSNNMDGQPGQNGEIEYFSDNVLKYCDGISWVPMSWDPIYSPNPIIFDGSTYLTRDGLFTGVTDSNMWTVSYWIKSNDSVASAELMDSDQSGGGGDITVAPHNDNGGGGPGDVHFNAQNSAGTQVLSLWAEDVGLEDGEWHHVLMSIDLSNNSRRHLVIDGVLLPEGAGAFEANFSTYNNAGIMDFTPPGAVGFSIGASTNGSNTFNGRIADYWVDFGTYIDLSVAANRQKFYNSGPVYLGANGNLPTGSRPDIFLSGDALTWHMNKGNGGGFSITGGILASDNDPPVPLCDTTPVTYNTPGQYTFTVPANCAAVTIEAYGAGGGGGPNTAEGGAGGGGGSVVETSDGTLLAVGGGGGGGGAEGGDGGGGGYALSRVDANSGEEFNIWVGGGGLMSNLKNGGAGGAVGGGAGGPDTGSGGNSTYGGAGGAGDDGGNAGTSVYGGGGGAGRRASGTAGESTYGGGGGGAESSDRGTSTNGLNGTNGEGNGHGGGGGGFGDTVMNGTTGGAAANSGPGAGGNNAVGGNGRVVITPIEAIRSVGHWKLDESALPTAFDSSGQGNNGTAAGNTIYDIPGRTGRGAEFDGTGDYIAIADSPIFDLDTTGQYSWSLWFNPDDVSGDWQTLFSQTAAASNFFYFYAGTASDAAIPGGGTTNGITVYWWGGGGGDYIVTEADNVIANNNWYHLVVTYDGSQTFTNRLKIYLNGNDVTGATNHNGANLFNVSPVTNIRIGGNALYSGEEFDGTIDDVRYYNRLLSAPQIQSMYQEVVTNSLVGHWKLDETTGTTVQDSSGNNYNGTMLGSMTAGSDSVAGRINNAMDFDGSNDRISMGDIFDFGTNQNFTVSAWMKVAESGGGGIIASKRNSDEGWWIGLDASNGNLDAQLDSGPVTRVVANNDYRDNTWHLVTATYDRSGEMRLYIDGILEDSVNISAIGISLDSTIPFVIGSSGNVNFPFLGQIDDVRVYNYALSAGEIQKLAGCTKPGQQFYNSSDDMMQCAMARPLMIWALI